MIRIDGQVFEPEDAEAFLEKAKELSKGLAVQAAIREAKRRKRRKKPIDGLKTKAPEITTDDQALEPLIADWRREVGQIYAQAAMNVEIRELMKIQERDEEDALSALL